MNLESRHLRLVFALDRTGSATGAGADLGVTQSAVSHQLRQLETLLKGPVCARVGKRLTLNAQGRRLLRTAQVVLPELDRATDDVRKIGDGRAGILRVCAQCHTGYHWLPPLLPAFAKRYPDVEVDVAVQHTSRPVDALLDGDLDLAFITEAVNDSRLRVRPLLVDEHAAIVAPTHPWAAARFITAEQLASETLLLYSSSLADSFTVREILAPAGVRASRLRFVQLTEAILEMVRAGLGVSVMPTWAIRPALARRDVRAVRITRAGVFRQWWAATRSGELEPAYLTDFLKMTRRAVVPAARGRARAR